MDDLRIDVGTKCGTDFSSLYEENYRRIFNYFLYGAGEIEAALDLTSDTFFKALRAWPRFENRGASPVTWLFKIASRELAMYFRKRGRTAITVSYDDEIANIRECVQESDLAVAQSEIDNCEEFLALSELMKRLPPRYREVVFLRFFADMSIREISDMLGRSSGTVKSQLHRSMKRLRFEMQPFGTE